MLATLSNHRKRSPYDQADGYSSVNSRDTYEKAQFAPVIDEVPVSVY